MHGSHYALKLLLFSWLATIIASYETFTTDKDTVFRQIVVDDISGNIYVGGDNYLCQLSQDLRPINEVNMGPVMDNANCIPESAKINAGYCIDQASEKHSTDVIVKILVIDNHQSALIICTNVYQGSCQMRNLGDITELVKYPTSQGHWVIANKGDNASFGFIAAGPSGTNVFYVGASYAEAKSALVILPSIAIRKIDKNNDEQMFQLFKNSESENKLTLSRSRSRTAHVIYNGGFASGKFRYFSIVKPVTPGSGVYKSRLIRICQTDEGDFRNRKLISYMEATLECKKEGVNYQLLQAIALGKASSDFATQLGVVSHSDIVIGVFAQAKENKAEPQGDSAICIYTIKEIEKAFENKTQDCWEGRGFSGLSFDGQNNRPHCNKQTQSFNICNVLSNSPLELDNPITKTAAFILQDDIMLSLTVASSDSYTVTFVGTEKGYLLKILLESDKRVSLLSKSQISETRLDKIALSKDANYVIPMAKDKIMKVPVAECETYSNCSSCIASNNPYCGWCVLKNRCSTSNECNKSDKPIHWKRGEPASCISITNIIPTSVPSNEVAEISFKVEAELPKNEMYECMFGKYGKSIAKVDQQPEGGAIVSCSSPKLVSSGESNVKVKLSLKVITNAESFVEADEYIILYNCKLIETCSECSSVGNGGCKWCPYDGGCIYQSSKCNTGTHITSSNVCPTLEFVDNKDFRIPAGQEHEFKIRSKYLPGPIQDYPNAADDYTCYINVNGVIRSTQGRYESSTMLVCSVDEFAYTGNKGVIVAPVSVKFAKVNIDKSKDIEVYLYKCDQMASDCSQCQGEIDSTKYQCSWCSATNQCVHHDEPCLNRLSPGAKKCPPPSIVKIYPQAGPVNGGTVVTIEGRNLGVEFRDIESIYIADVACNQNMYNEFYKVSTRVVCQTGHSSTANSGSIRITVRGEDSISSNVTFSYLKPLITEISPKIGPTSGGSTVTIYGENLNIGSSASVQLAGADCEIIKERQRDHITCQTTRAGSPKKVPVQLKIDKAELLSTEQNLYYEYVSDPVISSVEPACSHLSGGLDITLQGSNLNAIQSASIIIFTNNTELAEQSKPGECQPSTDNGRKMKCKSPTLSSKAVTAAGVAIPIAFKMDRTLVIRHINGDTPAHLNYYPDFTVDKWTNNTSPWSNNDKAPTFLAITGQHLTLSEGIVSVSVLVGELPCAVRTPMPDQIMCAPPSLAALQERYKERNKYKAVDENNATERRRRRRKEPTFQARAEKDLPRKFEVRVVLGNRVQSPGSLDYQVLSEKLIEPGISDIPLPVVLGIVVAIIVMAIVVTLLIFKYRRNSKKLTQESEVTKKKMQDMESQVARECKDAFTELQMTVMKGISKSGELGATNLPFLDFTTHATKVLFPNIEDLHRSNTRFHTAAPNNKSAIIHGLNDFNALLSSEPFLLNFIKTLELQPKFNMKDRCYVASLLMVALSPRLDYVTYIMTRLLCNLMKRPQIKTSPHLFLRRTESVAEKFLSNWLTFCLYDYVKQVAGKPLFMLYRAIKSTIEGGPVDMVTYEARYALSEERLLRQKVEFKTLNVFLQVERGKMAVTLLDCDTVTQAKAKLHDAWYKGTPVSRRIPVESLELIHVTPHEEKVLRDEDSSNVVESDWKRLNTLKHYKITDGAAFRFSADSNPSAKFRHFGDASTVHHFNNSNPKLNRSYDLSSSNPKINRRGSGGNSDFRIWHLSKSSTHNTIHQDQTTFVPEIYLTRLLTTKGSLQQFVNDLFYSVFSLSNGDIPPAIKFLFDLLDRQAAENGIKDADVIHTWKNNSIPLRYWINIIKNPEMILDVEKHPLIDSILSVIAQTYMESCSLSNHAYNTDSPSSKLLYAKELQDYKASVRKYYSDIQALPPVTDDKLYSSLPSTASMQLNREAALYDLAVYAHQYCYQIDEALQQDNCDDLSKKFASVISYLQLYLIPTNT